mmetsp:Transcript_40834/g.96975  ORF Transcript_40834/g.96975 Transcript_40834/m.96975 type:complete len:257 (-) Transcript_40834:231-1001(-)
MRVACRSVPCELAEDGRAPGERVLLRLQDHAPGALAHDEAVALLVEGARGAERVVVARGDHRPHRCEPSEGERGDGRFGSTRDHHVRLARLEEVQSVADGMGARGTRRRAAVVRTLRANLHGHDARGSVGHQRRNHRSRDRVEAAFAAPLRDELVDRVLEKVNRTRARAHNHPDAGFVELGDVEFGILDGDLGGSDAEVSETAAGLGELRVHPLLRPVPSDLLSHHRADLAGVLIAPAWHLSNSRLAIHQRLEEVV